MDLPLDYVPHEDFTRTGFERRILSPAPKAAPAARKPRPPAGLPAYLASLYDVSLLTREQEYHLFRRFNYLKYRAAKLRGQLDPDRPRANLLARIERLWDEAMETKRALIRANLRLVVSVARKRVSPTQDLFELISDGNLSLIQAVDKFDCSRGFKFSTYATWALVNTYSRVVTDDIRQATRFQSGRDDVLETQLDYRHDPTHEENAQQGSECHVAHFLSRLTHREREVIVRRFGLNREDKPWTLKQIGAELGITKERVRQLQARALNRLRCLLSEGLIELPD
jgi:RNA polymerase primary sigma factor/RNA polymerase sigma factor